MLKIRQSHDRLIFNMGIPYPERRLHLPVVAGGVSVATVVSVMKRIYRQVSNIKRTLVGN